MALGSIKEIRKGIKLPKRGQTAYRMLIAYFEVTFRKALP